MAQTINLNMLPKGIPNVVNASQFDVGREIVFKLYDEASVYTIPTGATVVIAGRKGDNNIFAYNATILDGRHSVKVVTTNQMTACAGENLCQLRVTKSGIDLATVNFTMFVQERPDASGNVSETDIPAIVSLASEQELNAEAWAIGTKGGVPVGSGDEQYENNAKHYAEEAESWAETFTGGTTYKDAIPFASIPVSGMQNGDLYNITDSFTTDSRFSDGSGHYHEAGTNIIWNNTKSKWDVAGGIGVRSVDSVLSIESTNPVQNKIITATKANALPFCVELSGNPITFNADAQAVQKLLLDLEPIQPLHGYDKPWVGGAGKNILQTTLDNIKSINTSGTWSGNTYTYNGISYTVLTDSADNVIGVKATSGTASATSELKLQSNFSSSTGTTYYLNGCPSGGSESTYKLTWYYHGYDTGTGLTSNGGNDSRIVSVEISSGYSIPSGGLTFTPMIRTSGDSSFAPYTNICPISGRTGTGVVTNGKNIYNKNGSGDGYVGNGYLYSNGNEVYSTSWTISEYIRVKSNTNLTISGNRGNDPSICYYDENKNYISGTSYGGLTAVTVTTPNNACYVRISVANDKKDTTMLEEGNTATAFEPYKANTASLSFGQTVYGCHVDFKTGKVTVDRRITALGNYNYEYNSTNNNFNAESLTPDALSSGYTDAICSCYVEHQIAGSSMVNGDFKIQNARIYIKDTRFTNPADLKTAVTGQEICFKLATPIELQLTPAELELLQGYNYITADGNINISLVPENVIDYVMGQIISAMGTNESGRTTASRAYSAKEYFYKDGKMYKCLTSIASGATFTVGTNCAETTIFAELTALNA